MTVTKLVNPYDTGTSFGKRLSIDRKQKSAIALCVADKFATHGDLAMFIADGTTAALAFRAVVCNKVYPTQFVTNNLDVCIQYSCVPDTNSRMREPVLIEGSLDQDANAIFPRWGYDRDESVFQRYLRLCEVVILGASSFTWDDGPRDRHHRRQFIRRQVLRLCQDKTVILVLPGGRFYSRDPQYVDEPAWEDWKNNTKLLRHLHLVTCVPEGVEDESNDRGHLESITPPPDVDPAAWAYVKETNMIRQALGDRFVEIKKGDWHAANPL